MRVIATNVGYDNIKLREPGEEFEMPDGAKGSWFVPVGEVKKAKPKQAKADPATLSEIGKQLDGGDLV
jgi:predicted NUDIX family NTP pyrophosphohydrolase